MATASRRLTATTSSSVVVKRVTFSQPPSAGSTSRTALTGSATKDKPKEVKKRRRHLMKVKEMSQPLLDSCRSTVATKGAGGSGGVQPDNQQTGSDKQPVSATSGDVEGGGDKTTCPDYFGVKSYLHNFYESVSVKNPDMYEELEGGDFRYLIRPKKPRCKSLWWKVAVWTGVNLLVAGVIVILVGYLVPRHPVVIGYQDDLEVIDRSALSYNYNLDACKLVGLIVFCIGGTVVAIALLFPSFLYNYCDEDWTVYAEPFKVGTSCEDFEPQSPTEKKVPATEELMRIQPFWDGSDQQEEPGSEKLSQANVTDPIQEP